MTGRRDGVEVAKVGNRLQRLDTLAVVGPWVWRDHGIRTRRAGLTQPGRHTHTQGTCHKRCTVDMLNAVSSEQSALRGFVTFARSFLHQNSALGKEV